jgi:hypothetical protein
MLRRMGTGTGTNACWSECCVFSFRKIKPPPIASPSLREKLFKHKILCMFWLRSVTFVLCASASAYAVFGTCLKKRENLICSFCTVLLGSCVLWICVWYFVMLIKLFFVWCWDRWWVHFSMGKHSATRSAHVGTGTGTHQLVVRRPCRNRIRALNCSRLVLFLSCY